MLHRRQYKWIFWLVQIIFAYFLRLLPVKAYLLFIGNVFLNESSFPAIRELFFPVETDFMASGNHLCPCLRYFSRNPSSWLTETHFSVQKKTYCCLLRTFFSASGNHYLRYKEAYLKLLLQPFYFIFPIFLSVGTDFLFSRNSILLFTDFFRDFCKTTLLLLVEANFVASRDDFFLRFSDIPTTVSFVFLTDINVFLTRILHFSGENGFSAKTK